MYVAVGHGLVVNLLTFFGAELAAIHPVQSREEHADLILVAAGQCGLQRCPHRERPLITHRIEHRSFNVEGLADHITTETELL